ncbi:unnamed protein product [Microthlaspi erraticum]|uniref:Uncharacterized protein n=1 Tax=Microthlaspi erraticum TaxID=1685480 RepID=A0A6D2JF44_9BRAS|nr:unnamed protein product [Microthlaspi erraticum]
MDLDMISANLNTIENKLLFLEEEKLAALDRLVAHRSALNPDQMQELQLTNRIRRIQRRIAVLLRTKEALIESGAARVAQAFNRDPPGPPGN